MIRILAAIAASLFWIGGADAADPVQVDLRLVFGVDVSRSVDQDEAVLQRQGYIDALIDPEVIAAITSGPHGRIAVSYFEWAGNGLIAPLVDWTLIDGEESARNLAAQLAALPLHSGRFTSISGAVLYAADLFGDTRFASDRKVIDLSGDGPNNHGPRVVLAREFAEVRGITVNGLPIINTNQQINGYPILEDLDIYYEECVITGLGAFVIVAKSFETFGAAIRRKLILEIAGKTPIKPPRIQLASSHEYDCLIGEKQLQEWLLKQGYLP